IASPPPFVIFDDDLDLDLDEPPTAVPADRHHPAAAPTPNGLNDRLLRLVRSCHDPSPNPPPEAAAEEVKLPGRRRRRLCKCATATQQVEEEQEREEWGDNKEDDEQKGTLVVVENDDAAAEDIGWEEEAKDLEMEPTGAAAATSKPYKLPESKDIQEAFPLPEGGVLLTTYDIVRNNYKMIRGNPYSTHNEDEEGTLWNYVILDEGHKIKNDKSQRAQNLFEIPCVHRIVISGTSIQNNLKRKLYEAFLKSKLVHRALQPKGSPLATITILKKICDHPVLLTMKAAEVVLEGMDEMLNDQDIGMVEKMAMNLADMTHDDDALQVGQDVSCKLSFIMSLLRNLMKRGIMLNSGLFSNIQDFQEGTGARIFLLTTQVGGVGFTLTKAARVIVVDPAWNPSTDNQSVDRAYRIGQIKDVIVYRLMTSATIEEKIYKLQVQISVLNCWFLYMVKVLLHSCVSLCSSIDLSSVLLPIASCCGLKFSIVNITCQTCRV
ncbi:Protein CHROMATIN REMODELING 24, partial [Dichanthelium oligosanthes]